MKTKAFILTILMIVLCCCAWFQLPPITGPTIQPPDSPPAAEETEVTGMGDQPTPAAAEEQFVNSKLTPVGAEQQLVAGQQTPDVVEEQQPAGVQPITEGAEEQQPAGVQPIAEGAEEQQPAGVQPTPEDAEDQQPADVQSGTEQKNDLGVPVNVDGKNPQRPSSEILVPTVLPTPEPPPEKKGGGGFATVILVIICLAAVAVGGYSAYHLYKNRKDGQKNKRNRPYQSKDFGTSVTITSSGPYICSGCKGQGKRDYQEDSYWYSTEIGPDRAVCVMIADGMGGMDNGAESSSIAAAKFNLAVPHIETDKDIPSKLWDVCRSINNEIYRVNSMKGMNGGTTLVCTYIIANRLYWISIGDSRIYLCRDGVLSSVNEEHELECRMYGELLDGKVDLKVIRETPNRELRKLTSNLGRSEIPLIDQNYSSYQLKSGDKLLLCSDGVSGTLSEQEILWCLESPDPEINCRHIREMIEQKNKPHQDNYSAIVIYCATEDGK